ncbi:MAG TPA: universal stress protein, partial [Saprospiraceae bacterium]|nr:universal stress protein [Saprospiraceae bacterium]
WSDEVRSSAEIADSITLEEFEQYKEQVDLLKRIARESQLNQVEVNYALCEAPDTVVHTILDEAHQQHADLIVMGTTGARGLKELFFGSMASKVMQSAPCPVMVIPDTANFRGIEKIGLTLEYKPGEMELVNRALDFARKVDAQLHCVHVDAFDAEPKRAKLADYAAAFAKESRITLHTAYDMNVERGILDFMKAHHMDIIMMEVKEQKHLKELFSYSIARRVSYHSDIPLLAFPNIA